MTPIVYDISIYQGAPWRSETFELENDAGVIDLTGYTGLAQIRKTPDSPNIVGTLTVAFEDDRKACYLTVTGPQAAALPVSTEGPFCYDVKLSNPQATDPDLVSIVFAAGSVIVFRNVSRQQG